MACALLARLRVPPEHWAAGFRVLAHSVLWQEHQVLKVFERWQQELSPEEKRQRAAELGFPNADFDAGVALRRAALAAGDADALQRHQTQCAAGAAWHHLRLLAAQSSSEAASEGERGAGSESGSSGHGGGSVPVGKLRLAPCAVEGAHACPEPAVHTFLADLSNPWRR